MLLRMQSHPSLYVPEEVGFILFVHRISERKNRFTLLLEMLYQKPTCPRRASVPAGLPDRRREEFFIVLCARTIQGLARQAAARPIHITCIHARISADGYRGHHGSTCGSASSREKRARAAFTAAAKCCAMYERAAAGDAQFCAGISPMAVSSNRASPFRGLDNRAHHFWEAVATGKAYEAARA